MNVLLAFVIFTGIAWLPATRRVGFKVGTVQPRLACRGGRASSPGDVLASVNGQYFDDFDGGSA